jgi:extracellular matrix regulatory protein B
MLIRCSRGIRMYIHVGNDYVIRISEIVAVLDKKVIKFNNGNYSFNEISFEQLDSNPSWKSIIITDSKVFLSPLSTNTIKKRIQMLKQPKMDLLNR